MVSWNSEAESTISDNSRKASFSLMLKPPNWFALSGFWPKERSKVHLAVNGGRHTVGHLFLLPSLISLLWCLFRRMSNVSGIFAQEKVRCRWSFCLSLVSDVADWGIKFSSHTWNDDNSCMGCLLIGKKVQRQAMSSFLFIYVLRTLDVKKASVLLYRHFRRQGD